MKNDKQMPATMIAVFDWLIAKPIAENRPEPYSSRLLPAARFLVHVGATEK